MMTDRGGWRSANEDAMSTGSNSSDPERNLQSVRNSESTLLRMPNVRVVPHASKQKAVITALAFTLFVIVGAVFGTLYFSGGNGSRKDDLQTIEAEPLSDHEVYVRDLSEDNASISHSDSAIDGDEEEELAAGDDPHAGSPRNSSTSTRRTRKKQRNNNRNRSRGNHGPRRLPEDAQELNAFSLLFEMKLANGRDESFTRYAKCVDIDYDNRKIFKGWRATIQVNLTSAGFNPDELPSNYTGYGTNRRDARRRAAEQTFTKLYPGQLQYAGKDDLKEIDEFCSEENNE